MRQAVVIASLAAFVAASPAPQVIDFTAVNAAPSPTLTGPAPGVNSQDVVISTAAIAAAGSSAATGVASASASASVANKKRNFIWPWGWPVTTTSTSPWDSKPTTTYSTSASGKTTSTAPPTTTAPTTTNSQTTTATTSSDTSCPTQPEAGTYCGFINPEDACAPQPDGYGPHVEPDTVAAFEAYTYFHQESQSAKAPSGYVSTFVDYNASVSANTYLGLQTLTSYDVNECAAYCTNKTLCGGFNIFFERDPSLNPSDNCTQPASITNIKCTLWGSGVDLKSATNYGDYRGEFQVVIAGSNGYTLAPSTPPPTQPGWQSPQQCGGDGSKAHNHPSSCIGTHFFPGPYDPSVCAAYANSQNAINKKSSFWSKWLSIWTGNYNPYSCNFFNSYMLKKDGKPLGTYCGLYSQVWKGSDATYTPGVQGGFSWSIETSWSYQISSSSGWKN